MDLYEQQIKLEEQMRSVTVQRFTSLHNKAAESEQYSNSFLGKNMVKHMLAPFELEVRQWIEKIEAGTAGRKPAAHRLIKDFDDIPTMCFLFLKNMVDLLPKTKDNNPLSRAAVVVKTTEAIHDELRLRWFNDNSRALLKQMLKDFDRRDVGRRRRRDLIMRTFNQRKLEWIADGWERRNRVHLGMMLLECFIRATGFVTTGEIRQQNGKKRAIVTATPELVKMLEERMEKYSGLYTVFWPMVVPPRAWSNDALIGGGYLTKNVTPYKLVKGAKMSYLSDLEGTDLTKVLVAINTIQETPFRVNKTIMDLCDWAYSNNLEVTDIPRADHEEIPEVPANIDEDEDVKREYKKQCFLTHDRNRRSFSKRISFLSCLNMAKQFAQYENIYFPHDMDSRGRLYPRPSYLSPQGMSYAKAMLEFGEGKPITEMHQVGWLAIHGANTWGEDKLALQERIDWVFENEDMILSIAADPKSDRRWMDADSPMEFVRFCLEWAGLSEEGMGFVSHLPIPMDATCSGLQHFSAMLRDKIGGTAVNLTDSETRHDIYQTVADRVTDRVTAELGDKELGHFAQLALDLGITRKLTKRQVMVVPYSGTFASCMKYTEQYYHDLQADGVDIAMDGKEFSTKFIPWMSKHIWDSIAMTVVAASETMDFLTKLTREIARDRPTQPFSWTTPAGFTVQQARWKESEDVIKTYLDGKQTKLSLFDDTSELDPRKNASSLSPNVIHSFDAAHLQLSICYAVTQNEQKMSFMMIHDSFAVHAADTQFFLNDCVKPSFHDMYADGKTLDRLVSELVLDNTYQTVSDHYPTMGDLDLSLVLDSQFFFS